MVSFIYRNEPKGVYYKQQITGFDPCISFQSSEELWFGAFKNGWGARRREELEDFLAEYEVVMPTAATIDTCARVRAEQERAGTPLTLNDAWIAATALTLGCPLATDDRDLANVRGLEIIQAPRGWA